MGIAGLIKAAAPVLLAGAAGAAIGGAFGGKGPDIPSVTAASTTPAKTAKRIEPVSEADKLKRRKQAAVFAEGFATPKLGKPGLLGLGI